MNYKRNASVIYPKLLMNEGLISYFAWTGPATYLNCCYLVTEVVQGVYGNKIFCKKHPQYYSHYLRDAN